MSLLNRKYIKQIKPLINKKGIIVLHGSRQVGKTSIMRYLIDEYLLKEKKVNNDNIFYFDLEDNALLDLCNQGPDAVRQYIIDKKAAVNKKIYLFIDEIQYLDNPSGFLKLFHDRWGDGIKIIVSGSSSFDIKSKFKDSLVGRTVNFEIFGLDFDEFLEFKNIKINTGSKLVIIHEELKKLYIEYLLYGGYPALVLEKNKQTKVMILNQIINTYIRKDIRDLAQIREITKFNLLIRLLASQSGNLLNISELSNTVKLSQQTVEDYIFILENTYIIKRVYPFYKNVRSELTKMPKIYFEDTGLMNVLAHKNPISEVNGQLLENSVYCEFRKNITTDSINYWRTNTGQEIDFIISNDKLVPTEVKMQFMNKKLSNLKFFMEKYKLSKAYVCALNKIDNDSKIIKHIYPWELKIIL